MFRPLCPERLQIRPSSLRRFRLRPHPTVADGRCEHIRFIPLLCQPGNVKEQKCHREQVGNEQHSQAFVQSESFRLTLDGFEWGVSCVSMAETDSRLCACNSNRSDEFSSRSCFTCSDRRLTREIPKHPQRSTVSTRYSFQ